MTLTDKDKQAIEKIAKDLPDDEFKDRYGDDWKSVKIATATKIYKNKKDKTMSENFKSLLASVNEHINSAVELTESSAKSVNSKWMKMRPGQKITGNGLTLVKGERRTGEASFHHILVGDTKVGGFQLDVDWGDWGEWMVYVEDPKTRRSKHKESVENVSDILALGTNFFPSPKLLENLEAVNEAKERNYVCVHAKKGKCEVKADSSYGAAKKAASKWGMKNTAGIDAYLAEEE